VRRFATIALSLCLLLGLAGAHHLFAQGESKKDETPKSEPTKPEASKEATPKPDAASASTESAPPPIPPEVEAKLEAARRAVAEAIVAAQDAGLVKTTIDPPPVLDILVTGRANDEATLKARTGVSPEVFGAWFSGYGTTKDINPQKDVRIIRPDAGLKELYNQRANLLTRHIEAVRKAQASAKKDEAPKQEDAKAKEDKKEEDAKKDETKPESKAGEAKKDNSEANPPKDEAKKDDNKGDASKDDAPK
jgi:hypothetical protein